MKILRIENLFPTPIMLDTLSRAFSAHELAHIQNLKIIENVNNRRSEENYILDVPEMGDLKISVQAMVNLYFKEIYKPPAGVEIYLTQSWLNVSTVGEQHHSHHHPNSFISGTLYIAADKELDAITFSKPDFSPLRIIPTEFTYYNSPTWYYNVGTGDLILFPSTLQHYVTPIKESVHRQERISISFNTFLKGTVGSEYLLSELKL